MSEEMSYSELFGGEEDPGLWELVVGLEVHTELRTRTKLFCGCPNEFGSEPNVHTCPVCLGLPGSLPVVNRQAVEFAIRIGLALNCSVEPSVFHRKNYFYPDMPKDYQVSQYDRPINANGVLPLASGASVGIERAHMEEDTGKITHAGGTGRIAGSLASLIDYNRAGVPLVEIVSRPDIRSPEVAREYVSELRAVLVAVGASDGKMEEGSLRVDANVSVRPRGSTELRTRCEIKNLNSLRSLGRAIEYEACRHVALYDAGESPVQQTRYWDENQMVTGALRTKEEAYDYRYFQEPDLVPLEPDSGWVDRVRESLGELPGARRTRILEAIGETSTFDQIETVITPELWPYMTAALDAGLTVRLALARTANELAAEMPFEYSFPKERFIEVLRLEESKGITTTQAKTLLSAAVKDPRPVGELVSALGLGQIDTSALKALVRDVLASAPDEWRRYCLGEEQVKGFLIGRIMKEARGKADGKVAAELLVELRYEAI